MDHYTRTISGRVEAARGRVIWRNRRLYVFTPGADPAVFDVPKQPRPAGRDAKVYAAAGVEWVKGPCGCGFPRDLKRQNRVLTGEADRLIADGSIVVQEAPVDA